MRDVSSTSIHPRTCGVCGVSEDAGGYRTGGKVGGPDGSRTRDLLNAIQARSQLRYRPTSVKAEHSILAHPDLGCHGRSGKSSVGRKRPGTLGRHRRGRVRRLHAAVRKGEPLRQLPCGFVRRLTVERHHRRRHSRQPAKLRAPPVADRRDFDLIRTPADEFFESMHRHVAVSAGGVGSRGWILRRSTGDTSEGDREGASDRSCTRRSCGDRRRKKSVLSGSPQDLHHPSTGFPQLVQCSTRSR